jgi:cytochrome c oxidase subunit 4
MANDHHNDNGSHVNTNAPGEENKLHHSHILPPSLIIKVGVALMIFTVLTVGVAQIDLGRANFFIAMLVATIKASLVAMIFMNLKYDSRQNAVIFCTSFIFLAIFITLAGTDIFFRGDVYVKAGAMSNVAHAKSKLKNPWISTPEMVANGKALFSANGCVTCHGEQGMGNGIGGAALNPPPRNFTKNENWKNGRRMAAVFKTLKNGLAPSAMASYSNLPADDRWQLAAYVLSLGPTPAEPSTPADFQAIGVDPSKPNGGMATEVEAPSVPIDFAMHMMETPATATKPNRMIEIAAGSPGSQIYLARCVSCHGTNGIGGARQHPSGGLPMSYVEMAPLTSHSASLQSPDAFNKLMINGLQGDLMPGNADLSGSELKELYSYVKQISQDR